jgi:hypothetical protein
MTTYTFTGPSAVREATGKCPVCNKRTRRRQTFEHTVNPFNRHATEDRPKTWDEVMVDVETEANMWVPNFTHEACRTDRPW